jgi:urease accessory protein
MMIFVQPIVKPTNIPSYLEKDFLDIEWYEAGKSIIRCHTRLGREIAYKKPIGVSKLYDGDVLHLGEDWCLTVCIKPCDCIEIRARSMQEMALVCYEIGNRHIPIFFDKEDTVLVAYERPLYCMFEKKGFLLNIVERKL